MAPKKVDEPEKKPLIGRVGTNLKVGIVGIPNVGKSTFFNVLTKSQAAAENFPFCTIDPNENKVFPQYILLLRMCNAELKRRKLSSELVTESEKYSVNKSSITKREYLRHVKGYPRLTTLSSWPELKTTWCPKANMYYAFNEDTNPFTRVSGIAKTICSCSKGDETLPHFSFPLDPFTERDPYSDDEARYKELKTDPICFVIFGKPGLNSKKLAKFIAEYWGCVLVSPEILLNDEINAKTDKGRWIKQVLRSGRSIGPEIVMNLVESRVKGKDVMHRGYVVEGIPLIPNDPDLDYAAYPDPSAVKNPNTLEKLPSFVRIEDDRSNDESEESQSDEYEEFSNTEKSFSSDSSRSFDLARNPFATESLRMILRDEYQWDIGNQMNEMFNTWPLKPTIIIYIICPDPDVVHKRNQFRLDPYTGNTIDTGLYGIIKDQVSTSKLNIERDNFESFELDQEIANEEALVDEDLRKHLLTRVSDRRANVEIQCRIFEKYALPLIERQVLTHNPQHVIRVDGRTSATLMFQIVRVRLRTLPLPRVILPKKMSEPEESSVDGEEMSLSSIGDDIDAGRSNEEVFQILTRKGAIAPKFRWRLSKWKFTCPVALAEGRKIEGSAKYAVRFMDKLYFMSSLEAVETLIENPRPFLLPPNPRPICKILIYGQKYSGKSSLAEFLANTYGGKILDLKSIEIREIEHRRNLLIRDATAEILDEVIEELTTTLENQREKREITRVAALKIWHGEARVVADKVIRILGNFGDENQDDKALVNSDERRKALEEIRGEIQEYNLTSLCTDHDLFERALWDKNVLLDFAPTELLTMEAPVRELHEQDPEVAAILAERTQDASRAPIVLTNDDISQLLIANINAAQTAPNLLGLDESGWVVDGIYANIDLLESLLEKQIQIEEVVVVHETEPYDNLIQKWHQYRRDNFIEHAIDEEENMEYDEWEGIVRNGNESEIVQDLEGDLKSLPSKSSIPVNSETGSLSLTKYIDELKQFEKNWERILEKVQKIGAGLIDVELQVIRNVESYVKQQIDHRYFPTATVMTDEEKDQEAKDANVSLAEEDLSEEEEEEEEEETARKTPPPKDNRRLGDTGVFCPVALVRHHVLWKGKEEFSVLFMHKIYLLSSQAALNDFVHNPHEFVPFKKPLDSIPTLRVSIVGPIGSGKSTLAKALGNEYGLVYINLPERLEHYLKDRSIPLVGREHEDIFALHDTSLQILGEPEEAAELPEDLEDQRYNCDRVTIQTFVRKYLKEGAALPRRMLKECLLDFFQPPYNAIGLVLDNFPANSYDADAACENFAVPELVLELVGNAEETQARMTSKMYDTWKVNQDEKKMIEESRFSTEIEKVAEMRRKWVSKKIKELRRQRRNQFDREEDNEKLDNQDELEWVTESDSFLKNNSRIEWDDSSDSIIGEPDEEQAEIDRFELLEESLTTYPDPVKFEDWEDPDAAKERIQQEIDEAYESSTRNLASAREIFKKQSIPWIEINAERNESSVMISALKILDPYIFRNASALERVQEIDLNTAERLLDCGYYLLSSFGRSCPVQMYENKIPFQMFLPAEAAQQIYPALHREYIYFLNGKERLAAFLEDPLKYLDQDSCTPLIPIRISIIGPPKCGKSTLANRFASTYGMKVITRGQALRHMLENFSWTELALLTNTHLQGGHTALNESIARAVELQSIDLRSVSQGYVLDGFPENQSEAEELAFLGLQPMIVIDLRADLDFCLNCLVTSYETLAKPLAYSPCFFSHRYEEWEVEAESFRNWLKKYAQNLVTVDATARKLAVWTRANDQVCLRFSRIKKYFRETDFDKAQSLTYMCVSPYEFRERQSRFESYCPVCLSLWNVLTFSGTPPNHERMVQFREHYYWLCADHLNQFLAEPLTVLNSLNEVTLPKYRPEKIDQEIDVNHACWAKRLKTYGFCSVSYVDNLPERNIVRGLNNLGVMFKDELYLFCSPECRERFICQPTKYADVEINFKQTLPPVKINNLPNLGFLEQTVARLIVRAVNKIGGLRAKLPGMTPAVTASVYIGVYLKIHNIASDLKEVTIYEEVMNRMNARRHLLQVALRNAKKMINPHVSFPREDVLSSVIPNIRTPRQTPCSSITSVKFRRDSPTQYFTLDEYSRSSSNSQSLV